MRIVGGEWAGRSLVSPGKRVRPTSEEIRAGWIQWLEPDLKGARVLDLFSGTGALGLEALSRGAASVDFVENGPPALHAIKANLAMMGAKKRTRLFKKDAFAFIPGIEEGRYDVTLADPPYRSKSSERLVALWLERPFSRILSIEHGVDRTLPRGGVRRVFGSTVVTTYRKRGKKPAAAAGPNPETGRK